MTPPRFPARPELASLKPYNSGLTVTDVASRAKGHPIAKLASNENPHGPNAAIQAAMRDAIARPFVYPDPSARALADTIALLTGAEKDRVILGDGSEDLLNVLARAVLNPGDEVVTLFPSFPLHEDYATMMGAKVTRIGLTPSYEIDMGALLDAAARPVRLTLLANPMNPAGLWLGPQELDALLAAQNPESLLCLDEAYVEYAAGPDYASATERLAKHDKPLLILRTFSKAYGLAGLRIGYGISNSDDVIDAMNLVRTPFNTNAVAQAAALAALTHTEEMAQAVSHTLRERARMAERLTALGLRVLPSKGNFLFVDCGQTSCDVADRLISFGVIVKPWKQEGFESFLRVSVGLDWENDQFLEAMARVL
ncbi:histidinol-phosphate transaminase [Salipiger sp. 1_MG-2023]|uniref:histidinol-phosphate transaminase n=1 Tax=Salipiger sp. 1_MG-2023 TaxID=3062665 RepID=UPI0026E2E3B1|nr:histidinol-phosphate transaminase [Salipiger sp. 1_MG-2023]MDO6585165.1 histidinol-phosphate transaminase [Salipiger sp. 1_MG-2023]